MLIESLVHFKEDDMFYIRFYISKIKEDHLYSQKKLINFTKVRYCYWVKKSKTIFKLLNLGTFVHNWRQKFSWIHILPGWGHRDPSSPRAEYSDVKGRPYNCLWRQGNAWIFQVLLIEYMNPGSNMGKETKYSAWWDFLSNTSKPGAWYLKSRH